MNASRLELWNYASAFHVLNMRWCCIEVNGSSRRMLGRSECDNLSGNALGIAMKSPQADLQFPSKLPMTLLQLSRYVHMACEKFSPWLKLANSQFT
jgi:hypothetical protein